jgi:hypothetical protein
MKISKPYFRRSFLAFGFLMAALTIYLISQLCISIVNLIIQW